MSLVSTLDFAAQSLYCILISSLTDFRMPFDGPSHDGMESALESLGYIALLRSPQNLWASYSEFHPNWD